MKKLFQVEFLFVLLILFINSSCSDSDTNDNQQAGDGDASETSEQTDGDAEYETAKESLFLQGCPVSDQATAMEITDPDLKMTGPDAIGTKGDHLLMNENAAFIIQAPENINAYYIHSGIVVDAVALDGCSQASPERFEEIGIMMGTLNATNYFDSVLRAFKGESIEVLNDGSDGKDAVVRVTGVDDYFWLVEYELLIGSYKDGNVKALTEPFGVKIMIDYKLAPKSNVLQIDVTIKNENAEEMFLICGMEIMFGDTTPVSYYSDSELKISSFQLNKGIPWMHASAGDGAWAASIKNGDMMGTNISGVTALLDFTQTVVDPMHFAPKGEEGDSNTSTFFLSVGATDSNSATKHLHAVNPEPIPDYPYTLNKISGTVVDKSSGDPLEKVRVNLQAQDSSEKWSVLDSFYTNEKGEFAGEIPDFGRKTMPYRLIAYDAGRPDFEPVTVDVDSENPYKLEMEQAGVLNVEVLDGNDKQIPAKVMLYKENSLHQRIFYVPGIAEHFVQPGEYEVSVSRGYEYDVYEGSLTVSAGKDNKLETKLEHMIDTKGFMSIDTHCHAGPSADNTILIPERIRTVAAEGLEVVVSTDHEYIGSWYSGVTENKLEDFVATVVGEEVTAAIPNHTNAFPFEPRFDIDARGGLVKWYGLDIGEIYKAERDRGAKITQLNHPRKGNYLTLIEYDRVAGGPTLQDPTVLGMRKDANLWSWDFNTIELMNGPDFIFMLDDEPHERGLFDDWMSFHNHGHKITAVGVSDAHNYGVPGRPRTYFVSSTDLPLEFNEDEMVTALKEGRAMVSAGAFARVKINNEATLGDTITDTDGEVGLSVHIEAIPKIDIAYFKVYVNCDQVLNIKATDPDKVVKYDGDVKLTIDRDSHVVVLAFGTKEIPRGLKSYNPHGVPRVTTNPIFVDFDGNGKFDAPGGKTCTYDLDAPQ